MKVAVIGGGAAGFFSAIHVKINHPEAQVVVFEKSKKLLSKVKVSGGGRCNVTNGCTDVDDLVKAYPRGGRRLKKAFHLFNTVHTRAWFEARGVRLYEQEDGRVFPVSDDSQSIIDCLLQEVRRSGIRIAKETSVTQITPLSEQVPDEQLPDEQLLLTFADGQTNAYDKVIVAFGGAPTRKKLGWLEALGHKIEEPVPSLFTFNMPAAAITQLMGLVVEQTLVDIQGTKLKSEGPLLITHWGMSGPAVLKLSAFGARMLSDMGYQFKIRVNWINESNNEIISDLLKQIIAEQPKKMLSNERPQIIPKKLWLFLLDKCDLPADKRWEEIGKKALNKLVNILTNDVYEVRGKTSFKEEFVTCGGISLKSVDMNTMQSKVCKNLYFAGEVLDIDAITGGYNFQSAWTTGFIAGMLQ
ncbi:MAG: NAD(P)/FAD-dependent oxidoreductase [Rhodothermales bacterium]